MVGHNGMEIPIGCIGIVWEKDQDAQGNDHHDDAQGNDHHSVFNQMMTKIPTMMMTTTVTCRSSPDTLASVATKDDDDNHNSDILLLVIIIGLVVSSQSNTCLGRWLLWICSTELGVLNRKLCKADFSSSLQLL